MYIDIIMDVHHPTRVFYRNEASEHLKLSPVMVYEMFSVLELERAHLSPISAKYSLTLVVTVEGSIGDTKFHEIPLGGLLENQAFPDCVFFYKGNAKMQLPLGEGIKKVSFSIDDSSRTMFNMKLICQFR